MVCDKDKIREDGVYGAPDWIVEIISKSTAEKDMTTKVMLYKNYGVKEYWIINPFSQTVFVYIFSPEFSRETHSFSGEICPFLYPDLKLKWIQMAP